VTVYPADSLVHAPPTSQPRQVR